VHYGGDRSFTFAKALDFSGKMRANIFKEEIGDTDMLTRKEHIIHPGHFPDETAMFESGSTRPRFGRNKLEDPTDMLGMQKLGNAYGQYEWTHIKNAPKTVGQAMGLRRHRDFAENIVRDSMGRGGGGRGSGSGSGGGGDDSNGGDSSSSQRST
jgi:uncharacterized membrane protein YgcG